MEELVSAMSRLDKDRVVELVKTLLNESKDPLEIIETLRKGLEIVGEKFEKGEYFLMDLMWSAEIFKAATEIVLPEIEKKRGHVPAKGKLLIGTVKGDIHDVGKNLVIALARCAGFEVIDLGVDVPPEVFVENVKKHKPDIVGMSGLLTASIEAMQNTIEALEKAGVRDQVKIIVGGGVVGEDWVEGKLAADARAKSAIEGIKIMEQFVRCKRGGDN